MTSRLCPCSLHTCAFAIAAWSSPDAPGFLVPAGLSGIFALVSVHVAALGARQPSVRTREKGGRTLLMLPGPSRPRSCASIRARLPVVLLYQEGGS